MTHEQVTDRGGVTAEKGPAVQPPADAPEASPHGFPAAGARTKGYDRTQVDAFLTRARQSFEEGSTAVTSTDIRQAAFTFRRHGYDIAAVDAALGRIEDAFAARERERAIAVEGAQKWVERARTDAQVLLDRLTRPAEKRFQRSGIFRSGYAVDEVDQVVDRIVRYLASGERITVEQVRSCAFRMRRHGYREEQVDAVLDAVVDVILAVR